MEHCDIHTTLQDAGLSKTSQRVAVLSALLHTDIPLCARDILEQIGGDCRSTKSRCTASWTRSERRGSSGRSRRSTARSSMRWRAVTTHLHPHFYCRICRNLSCMPASGITENWLQRFRWQTSPSKAWSSIFRASVPAAAPRKTNPDGRGHPMERKKFWRPLALLLFCFLALSCQGKDTVTVPGRLVALTTLFPLYDFAKNVAGGRADVSLLLPPGSNRTVSNPGLPTSSGSTRPICSSTRAPTWNPGHRF